MAEDEQNLRQRPDMCAVLAVESLVGTLLGNDSFQVPQWVWTSRAEFMEKNKDKKTPDDNEELRWLNTTIAQLQREMGTLPTVLLFLRQVRSIAEIERITQQGSQIIVFGRTSDGRTPHMFHLGRHQKDVFGNRFVSHQQVTNVVDLADFFMRRGDCNIAITQVQRAK